jgi:outer membrane protein TolC
MSRHPGLAKVAAKKLQAEQLHEGSEALRRPQVFAFGQRELKDGHADWVAGIGVRINLYDSLDHAALGRAGAAQIAQAEATDAQARSDIALLVEKQWRATEQARQQYLGMQAAIALAQELVRLRTAGVREGTGTTLELIDAETNLAKVQAERAQVAYEYVMALAGLLQACGEPERLGEMLAAADLRIENER